MKTTRISQALLVAVIGSVALIGCKKKEEAQPVAPAITEPTPAPVAAAPAAVSSVTLGNAIGADNTIATPLTTFAAGDTIHASIATDGGTAANVGAKWSHVDSNQTVHEESRSVPAGPQVTEFRISKPDGWPTGKYKLEVSLDGSVVNTTDFDVK